MKSAIKWKGSVGKGWESIVEATLEDIENHGGYILQVKEKFGGLRIYTHGGDYEYIADIVRAAENRCDIICEDCGELGHLRNNKGWYKTLCEKCMEKMERI